MKIALISPYPTISAFGLRTVSACLKRENHDVKLIFLPRTSRARYEERALNELVLLVEGSSLIGISLMTNYFDNAVQVTRIVKQAIGTPVVWGGIHATIRPEECLEYADMVCLGEGESTVLELARKMRDGANYRDTRGMWFKEKGGIIRNELRPLIQDLDSVPFQDYDYRTHYVLSNDGIRLIDEDLIRTHLRNDYLAHPTRGCPFGCTYCCNNMINKMYPDRKSVVRKRSVGNIVGELMDIRNRLPFINHITFDDDAFFCYSEEEISVFSEEYERKIGLPLEIRGANPASLTRTKMSLLVNAGLTGVRMGIQTGSERTKKLYKRAHSNEKVEECVRIIHEFRDKIPLPRYDIIVNNPWETEEDLTKTLMLFARFPKPYLLNMFSLTFYPGTELYDKAVQDGIITDDLNDVYRKSYNLRAKGTSGKLVNESYFSNLFYLLYTYSLNGYDISAKTWSVLANRQSTPLRSRLLYFVMKLGAGLLLKRQLVRDAYESARGKGLQRDEYALD